MTKSKYPRAKELSSFALGYFDFVEVWSDFFEVRVCLRNFLRFLVWTTTLKQRSSLSLELALIRPDAEVRGDEERRAEAIKEKKAAEKWQKNK